MRLIDAHKLQKAFYEHKSVRSVTKETIIGIIKEQPTVDPVKHGRWIDGTCSECGKHAVWRVMLRGEVVWEDAYEFCPHCGAKMDEEG